MPQFRDPIHGFISITEDELRIVNSAPFQRLRNIRQLATTYLVYHGAEHTRFGHSLGVMHLVARVFDSVTSNELGLFISNDSLGNSLRTEWYRQILRLIALTHDLGHAPFSHVSEELFAEGLKHEHYTKKIIEDTVISEYITEIGAKLQKSLSKKSKLSSEELIEKYNIRPITPQLLWMIYEAKQVVSPEYIFPDFNFLKSFMDGELDCDKMDYLLRDSLYCGVTYGKYDLERFISTLTAHKDLAQNSLSLAICSGGVQALEEFVLARYFMFIQVYFHKTRRHFDRLLIEGIKELLPGGAFPKELEEYIKWDDIYVLYKMKLDGKKHAKQYLARTCMTCVYESSAHPSDTEKMFLKIIPKELQKNFPDTSFEFDEVDKEAHKLLPREYLSARSSTNADENDIKIIDKYTDEVKSMMNSSLILKGITKKIFISRIYAYTAGKDVSCIKDWINSKKLEYLPEGGK